MTGSGTVGDPYIISDLGDLQAMADGVTYAADAYYELGCAIDASPTTTWNWSAGRGVYEGFLPRAFTGSFDGKDFAIDGLYVDRYAGNPGISVGLFGIVSGATVKDVDVTNADITGYGSGTAAPCSAGVLAGQISSGTTLIQNIYTSGNVSGTCRDTASSGGHSIVGAGGLIGNSYGTSVTIEKCASSADVTATALEEAVACAGGLVGKFSGNGSKIRNCYARGDVTASKEDYPAANAGGLVGYVVTTGSIDDTYATGAVTSNDEPGGLVGRTDGTPSNTNSFWDTETSGQAISDGGTGHITTWMKTKVNFTDAGWDFSTIWIILPSLNDGYPCFGDGLLVFPSDDRARVSSVRHVYRPGLYRMEVSLGDLGFDVDVSEAAMRKVAEGVAEPEKPEEAKEVVMPTPEEIEQARQRFQEESWPKAVESMGIMTTPLSEWPTVSGKWTAPQPRPKITYTNPVTGEPLTSGPTKRKFLITYVGGKTTTVESVDDSPLAMGYLPGIVSVKEIK